jgi:hypothetical protein
MAYTPADAADSDSGRRTRTRGTEALGCTAVLEQLRAIRKGEIRASDASQVKIDEPIYDTIPEEYNALVAHRHKEADEFIIDNDGLGYDDDGRRTGTRTRTRGTEASRRTAVLYQLRAIRRSEIRDAIQVKVDGPITTPSRKRSTMRSSLAAARKPAS